MIRRYGKEEGLYSLIVPSVFYSALAGSIFYVMWPYFYYVKNEHIIILGAFAIWRYGWQALNYVRSLIYAVYYYPLLKRKVDKADPKAKFPEHIYFIIPSYGEEYWVSIEVFQSILSNMVEVPCRATIVVATSSSKEDAIISRVFHTHPGKYKVDLVFQRQSQGKRIAMGHMLRAVARRFRFEQNSVTIFMDGDSYLETNTLLKTIPFFSVYKDLGALTTNEVAHINTRSQWYKDWFNLKFGQRHVLFQSHSLSNRVLTLTGRFSMFRSSIVVDEKFIQQIENDTITHWSHGKFRFLMGDDKSSWFYLLKENWRMLYIPDVLVYSLESRDASFFDLSTSLPYRWYGNTLRNNSRALALGTQRLGWFIWWAVLDQRLSMWTSLVGLSGATILAITKSFVYLPFYLAWVLFVRIIQMTFIAARGHPVSLLTIPLMLYNQWVGAIIKIRAYFFLHDQKWQKGKQDHQAGKGRLEVDHPLFHRMPAIRMSVSYFLFFSAIVFSNNLLSFPKAEVLQGNQSSIAVNVRDLGALAGDGQDDSMAFQKAITLGLSGRGVHIEVPPGQYDFFEPLLIRHDRVFIEGAGRDKTRLVSHLKAKDQALISYRGEGRETPLTLTESASQGTNKLTLSSLEGLKRGDLIWIGQPNDKAFMERLGSEVWFEQYPWVRQRISPIQSVANPSVHLTEKFSVNYPASAKVYHFSALRGGGLSSLSLVQAPPIAGQSPDPRNYENAYPAIQADLVMVSAVRGFQLSDVELINAGRHALHLDSVYGCAIKNIRARGAWNKGKGGSGYVRFSRAFGCRMTNSQVDQMRHLAIQWSSANNQFKSLRLGVDINFHGGFSRDNHFQGIVSDLPDHHPWNPIERTPPDASWAPPDGPGNSVSDHLVR